LRVDEAVGRQDARSLGLGANVLILCVEDARAKAKDQIINRLCLDSHFTAQDTAFGGVLDGGLDIAAAQINNRRSWISSR